MAVSEPIPPIATEIAGAPWWMLPGLATMAMLIFAGALAASCFLDNETLRTQMFTAAAVGFGTSLGFFFGSSAGSQKKDETIAAGTAALAVSSPAVPPGTTTITTPTTAPAGGAPTA